jgi:hypothetical protein
MRRLTFSEFLAGQGRSGGEWVFGPEGMELYVRRSIRVAGAIELANIEVPRRKQRRGIFSGFLRDHAHLPLKIENVLNSGLEKWLLRQSDWSAQDESIVGYCASYLNQAYLDAREAQTKARQYDETLI